MRGWTNKKIGDARHSTDATVPTRPQNQFYSRVNKWKPNPETDSGNSLTPEIAAVVTMLFYGFWLKRIDARSHGSFPRRRRIRKNLERQEKRRNSCESRCIRSSSISLTLVDRDFSWLGVLNLGENDFEDSVTEFGGNPLVIDFVCENE